MLKNKFVAIGAMFAFAVAIGGMAYAQQSKCDSGVSKAAGKKFACKASAHAKAQAKGTSVDPDKLFNCELKFHKACEKAKARGDCIEHDQPCEVTEYEVDACIFTVIISPGGAFLQSYSHPRTKR